MGRWSQLHNPISNTRSTIPDSLLASFHTNYIISKTYSKFLFQLMVVVAGATVVVEVGTERQVHALLIRRLAYGLKLVVVKHSGAGSFDLGCCVLHKLY